MNRETDLNLKDIRFKDHGTWMPTDGMQYHYFSEARQQYVPVSSIDDYGGKVTAYFDGGYSSFIIPKAHRKDMRFKMSLNPEMSYDRYGVLLINGVRPA